MTGELYINGIDAWTEYGVGIEDGGLSILDAPSPMKSNVSNNVRLEHGTRVATASSKVAEREINLPMHLVASDMADYNRKHDKFMEVLEGGEFTLELPRLKPGIVFHMIYENCNTYSVRANIALFTLRLLEPNPKERA